MTFEPFPETFLPVVDEDEENRILHEIAEEWAEEIYAEIDAAFPNYVISPAVQLPPRERLAKYLLRIVEAYPVDEIGRLSELNNLLNPDFVDLYKQGLVLPPLSMPWATLIRVPRIFKDIQRDFRQCYKTWADRMFV